MAMKLDIRDANGNIVSAILAERYAFLKWRRAWAKRLRFPARKVAIAIALEKPPTTMLADTGAMLDKLGPWIDGETKCELVVRVPDREDFAEHEVWQPWSATTTLK